MKNGVRKLAHYDLPVFTIYLYELSLLSIGTKFLVEPLLHERYTHSVLKSLSRRIKVTLT